MNLVTAGKKAEVLKGSPFVTRSVISIDGGRGLLVKWVRVSASGNIRVTPGVCSKPRHGRKCKMRSYVGLLRKDPIEISDCNWGQHWVVENHHRVSKRCLAQKPTNWRYGCTTIAKRGNNRIRYEKVFCYNGKSNWLQCDRRFTEGVERWMITESISFPWGCPNREL
jgi:hypothetical protein